MAPIPTQTIKVVVDDTQLAKLRLKRRYTLAPYAAYLALVTAIAALVVAL